MSAARLIHLNGPPGIGKSTLALRYAADHPGVLVCDIDRLRTMVAGSEHDFSGAGERGVVLTADPDEVVVDVGRPPRDPGT